MRTFSPYTYLLFTRQSFLRISGFTKIFNKKITFQCIIFIVPEEGWFGQPKYSTHIKTFLRCTGFCLYFLHFIYVKPVRSPLIQRTPAGSSFRLLAQTFYSTFSQRQLRQRVNLLKFKSNGVNFERECEMSTSVDYSLSLCFVCPPSLVRMRVLLPTHCFSYLQYN